MICLKSSVGKVAIRVKKNEYFEGGLTVRKADLILFTSILIGKRSRNE